MLLSRNRDRSIAAVRAADELFPVLEAEIARGERAGSALQWAADISGIGIRQIGLAIQVRNANPEIYARVKTGELSLSWAYDHVIGGEKRLAAKNYRDRSALVDSSTPEKSHSDTMRASQRLRPVVCKAELRRMVEACSQIAGFAKGLDKLHVDRICNNGKDVGIDYWDGVLTQAAVDLRAFKRKLRSEYERKIGSTDPAKKRADQDDKGSGALVEDSPIGAEASD